MAHLSLEAELFWKEFVRALPALTSKQSQKYTLPTPTASVLPTNIS